MNPMGVNIMQNLDRFVKCTEADMSEKEARENVNNCEMKGYFPSKKHPIWMCL